jgi:predicted RecB family nuclease
MIYLSASSISDFLACSKRYKFRIFDSDFAEKELGNTRQNVGIVVHKILEDRWDHRDDVYNSKLISDYKITDPALIKLIGICLNNFYRTMVPLLNYQDKSEYSFKIKYNKDVNIVGRMDRITKDGTIYDWKTSSELPTSIDSDIQFILYHWAYKQLFNKEPQNIFLVSLLKNRLVKYSINNFYYQQLMEEVVPSLIKDITNKTFYREGIYKNICKNCAFKRICLEEGRT